MIYEEVGSDLDLCLAATSRARSHVYLLDRCTPDRASRVAPEDIVGAVALKAGKVVRGSSSTTRGAGC